MQFFEPNSDAASGLGLIQYFKHCTQVKVYFKMFKECELKV